MHGIEGEKSDCRYCVVWCMFRVVVCVLFFLRASYIESICPIYIHSLKALAQRGGKRVVWAAGRTTSHTTTPPLISPRVRLKSGFATEQRVENLWIPKRSLEHDIWPRHLAVAKAAC